jgi:wobble nucleotide-excising tRNase
MLRVGLDSLKNRISNIYELDPLLKKFDSDYQYLFSRLIEFEKVTDEKKSDLTLIYPYPNMARRVLEVFLSFRFPSKSEYKDKIDSTKASKKIKESVYRFTNLKSHGTLKEAEGFSPEIIEPTSKNHILDVLRLMREEDGPHCKEMEDSL